jgi:predicted amidohydrolase YtcJ
MRRIFFSVALTVLSACAPLATETGVADAAGSGPDAGAEITIFTGGTIYTGLANPRTVEAVVVDISGVILGTAPPLSKDWSDDEVEVIDLAGAVMFPGFTDAHAHLSGIGTRELTLDLTGTISISDLVMRAASATSSPDQGRLIIGRGWIETGWPEGRMPTAADLDAETSGQKLAFIRADGHALVATSAALAAAGITDATPDPEGGRIERGPDGKATGLLIDRAMDKVLALSAAPDAAALSKALATGAEVYAARGWTGMHNMSVTAAEAPLMAELANAGRMPLRLWNAFAIEAVDIAAQRLHETPAIRNRTVKVYMDGALGSRGALLLKPYSDQPKNSGLSLLDTDSLGEIMADAKARGFQLAIHAIGDRANRNVLDAFERGGHGKADRWRIEHTQVLAPEDIARIGRSGLIASMQPSHAIGDLKFAPARLGQARLGGAYAWKSLLREGVVIAGGSDAPVEVGSPLIEFYAAVARKDLQGNSGEGWHPEQALTREEALALFTTAPAYASFQEADLGTIEAGKRADFTVFDKDLMTIPEAEILTAKPVMTVVDGAVVWRDK